MDREYDPWSELPPPGAGGRRGSVRIREMAELADVALLAVSRDGRIILGNAAAAALTGLAPDALAGLNLLDAFEPQPRHSIATVLARARSDGRLTVPDVQIVSAGAARRVDVTVTGSRMEPDEVVVALRDVTERSEMREEIRHARSFFAGLIQQSAECVVAADMKGTIILFNDGAERLLGYRAADAIGRMHITRIYRPGKAQEVMRALRSGQPAGPGGFKDFELDAVTSSGETVPVHVRAAIIYQDGREVASVGYFHDIRDRLKMERELRDTQLQLLQAEKMASLGKLAAGIAHQINNPLAGIMLFAELLLEKSSYDPDALDDLQRIIENANRCREIVKDLLDFARQTRRTVAPVDLGRSLRRTIFLLANQPLFHNIEIVYHMDPELPSIHADEQQLNQVFMNLVLNAAEAMNGRGRLTIRTRSVGHAAGDDGAAGPEAVEFEIEDTGCGIAPGNLDRIFEPFFTTKERGKGTGLGLSVAYGIVSRHGGTIEVRSREGLGTTFTARLPIGSGIPEEGIA